MLNESEENHSHLKIEVTNYQLQVDELQRELRLNQDHLKQLQEDNIRLSQARN